MIYKEHAVWRDEVGLDSGVFDTYDMSDDQKELIESMRDDQPKIPYTLEVECDSYWGNFEREFIAYSMGILDDVQMNIRHSEEELEMFWQEVFGRSHIDFEYALEHYVLLQDYLFETFQECDDWEQLTFYSIDWDTMHKEKRDVLKIQLAKPLDEYWEGIIIPRIKDFFAKHIYEDKAKLISIKLFDQRGQVVKEY
jgi:DNA primase